MTSLRSKFAALLVLAIVAVVALATIAAVTLVRGPARERTIDATAIQLHGLLSLARALPTGPDGRIGPFEVQEAPPTRTSEQAEHLDRMEHFLGDAIARTGEPFTFVLTQPHSEMAPTLSMKVDERGWIATIIPDAPVPENVWPALAGWMALIVVGALAIALFVAAKIGRPLGVLQDAVALVGDEGVLPELPETGPAEVRATAIALNTLSARLKSSMQSRMRLVAAAGHDLRTPMTRMRLRAEFLPDEDRDAWLADLHELDQIADSAIRLVREEAEGDRRPEEIALAELIRAVAAEIAETGGSVILGLLPACTVHAPKLALKRALRNLLQNAVLHGGGARVELLLDRSYGLIVIDDEGPGIPPELLAQVFEPFFRVDPGRRKSKPGAGLGLAIAHEIVTQVGGGLAIANRAEGGLRQTIRLPLRAKAASI